MNKLIDSVSAISWLALCLGVALVLLSSAILFRIYSIVRKNIAFGKVELPSLRFAK